MSGIQVREYKENKYKDRNGFSYVTISNDENGVRLYTLNNGLKVYLAKNTDAPRIQTYIPVRAGSNDDPADNTGLAHYLEHMMFKGTSKIGTSNWEKEKVLLEKISLLFEQHKQEKNPDKKKEIYKQIDDISHEASQYAIANEYDKAITSLGATGTNAHTWLDETVYKNNIPSNELEKWFRIESERFSELVLRLFHTELETVYEEFNMGQDNDIRQMSKLLMEALFPTHPNGQKTTIGESEHLKNPSMEAIHKYFEQYYVPNNYALVLVGDLDFDKTIQLAEKYFGKFEPKELPKRAFPLEQPMTKIVSKVLKSPSAPRLQMAWRTSSYGTADFRLADMVSQILSNTANTGLIDLNLIEKHKLLSASAYALPFKQYGYIAVSAVPKDNQSLEEAKQLVLDQIDLIKKGQFPDWILTAIINNMKISKLKSLETADGLAINLYSTYIREKNWISELEEIKAYEKITKTDVMRFAHEFFGDNYAIVYKEKGENKKLVRVENPGITPVKINRANQSSFLKSILNTQVEDIQPQFVDFKKEIKIDRLNGIKVSYIPNKKNNVATLSYIFPFGTDHNRELGMAFHLFEYLGTHHYTPEALKQEFFKLGISYNIRVGTDTSTITLTGLEENLSKGAELFSHWLQSVEADDAIYKNVVQSVLESREIAKKDKRRIMMALNNYARYGRDSRFRDQLSKESLLSAKAEDFVSQIKNLMKYDYQVFFYGRDLKRFKQEMHMVIKKAEAPMLVPAPKLYPEPETTNKVYFVNYDMVQVDLVKVARVSVVNIEEFGKINVFNEYFGSGLSSIVFQEIREARSLAYSAYVNYVRPVELGKYSYVVAYLGTQANKLGEAVEAMNNLMINLPQVSAQFINAKNSSLKQIASQRLIKQNIFYNYLAMQKLGLDYDVRQDVYRQINHLDLAQLTDFYDQKVKPASYNVAVMGKKEHLDMEQILKMGTFEELTLEDIFGY